MNLEFKLKTINKKLLSHFIMTISIIGSGRVGASVALNCGIRELDPQINLIDIIEGLPQGEAMDINHQLSEQGLDSYVEGSNDYGNLKDSDIVVLGCRSWKKTWND